MAMTLPLPPPTATPAWAAALVRGPVDLRRLWATLRRYRVVFALVFLLVFLLAFTYGPVAALLIELFPARIRYTGMSVPYHLGTGWFGGLTPAIAFALVAWRGDIYFGLWFPTLVALTTAVIGVFAIPNRRNVDLSV